MAAQRTGLALPAPFFEAPMRSACCSIHMTLAASLTLTASAPSQAEARLHACAEHFAMSPEAISYSRIMRGGSSPSFEARRAVARLRAALELENAGNDFGAIVYESLALGSDRRRETMFSPTRRGLGSLHGPGCTRETRIDETRQIVIAFGATGDDDGLLTVSIDGREVFRFDALSTLNERLGGGYPHSLPHFTHGDVHDDFAFWTAVNRTDGDTEYAFIHRRDYGSRAKIRLLFFERHAEHGRIERIKIEETILHGSVSSIELRGTVIQQLVEEYQVIRLR